jgi:hypothetical protein
MGSMIVILAVILGGWQFVPVNATVIIPANTQASTGASVNPTAAGTLKIFKDTSATPRSSANGVTWTIGFDGVVGTHQASIDTSDNSDVGFYATGHTYSVMLSSGTVDGQTVNAFLGTFYLGTPVVNATTIPSTTADAQTGATAALVAYPATKSDALATVGANVLLNSPTYMWQFSGTAGRTVTIIPSTSADAQTGAAAALIAFPAATSTAVAAISTVVPASTANLASAVAPLSTTAQVSAIPTTPAPTTADIQTALTGIPVTLEDDSIRWDAFDDTSAAALVDITTMLSTLSLDIWNADMDNINPEIFNSFGTKIKGIHLGSDGNPLLSGDETYPGLPVITKQDVRDAMELAPTP